MSVQYSFYKGIGMRYTVLAWLGSIITVALLSSCAQKENPNRAMDLSSSNASLPATDTATFGTGCFWCTEAIFDQVDGVLKVTSGYSGGNVPNPTYEQVSKGTTGHAESCQIIYDPAKITYDELLKIFWKTHDPTTLNRQGNDEGPQYRSVIFYHNESQKEKAGYYKDELNKSGAFPRPVITAIEPYKNFYPAEDYHQNYYANNPNQPYCYFVIKPKLEKFEKVFRDRLKRDM